MLQLRGQRQARSIRRRLERHLAVALAVVAVLATSIYAEPPQTPAAGNPGPEPSKPFAKIPIDLNSGGIEQTLPFDIPFYFSGTADQNVKRFDLSLREGGQSAGGSCSGKVLLATAWQRREGAGSDFLVLEPQPLEANQMYCLSVRIVRTVSAATIAAFKQDASLRIDVALKALPTGEVTMTQAEAIRRQLVALLVDPVTGDQPSVLPGSIFVDIDQLPQDQQDAVKGRFRDFLRDIKQQQDVKTADIEILARTTALASESMQKWSGPNGPYRAFLDRLDQIARTNTAVEAVLTTRRQAVRDLLALTDFSLARAIDGAKDAASAANLDQVWDPADLDGRATRVKATEDRITAALNILKDMLDDAHKSALSSAEQAQAASLLAAVTQTQALVHGVELVLIDMSTALQRRRDALTRVMEQLGADIVQNVSLVATTVGNFATRHAWYLGADIGFAVVPGIEETTPYVGMNIYFRPVNKDAPLRRPTDSIGRRASVMVGITMGSDLEKSGQRVNLFDSRMLLVGAGLRINDSLRIGAGTLWFKAPDPNPFVDDTRLKFSFYFSASVDWDVKGTFTSLGSKQP